MKQLLFLLFILSNFAVLSAQSLAPTSSPVPGTSDTGFCPYTFLNNLKIGDRSNDVLRLQKILNSDSRTIISVSGVASPGAETDYFGKATEDALKRFQALFIEYIGVANGKFGPKTRTVMNAICNNDKFANTGQHPYTTVYTPVTQTVVVVNPVLASSSASSTQADTIPPAIFLRSNLTSVNDGESFRAFVSASEEIKLFSGAAFIVEGANIGEIRKLSPKEYMVVITPQKGVTIVSLQIEADRIEDLAGNLNQNASNEIRVSVIQNFVVATSTSTSTPTTTGIFDYQSMLDKILAQVATVKDNKSDRDECTRNGKKVPCKDIRQETCTKNGKEVDCPEEDPDDEKYKYANQGGGGAGGGMGGLGQMLGRLLAGGPGGGMRGGGGDLSSVPGTSPNTSPGTNPPAAVNPRRSEIAECVTKAKGDAAAIAKCNSEYKNPSDPNKPKEKEEKDGDTPKSGTVERKISCEAILDDKEVKKSSCKEGEMNPYETNRSKEGISTKYVLLYTEKAKETILDGNKTSEQTVKDPSKYTYIVSEGDGRNNLLEERKGWKICKTYKKGNCVEDVTSSKLKKYQFKQENKARITKDTGASGDQAGQNKSLQDPERGGNTFPKNEQGGDGFPEQQESPVSGKKSPLGAAGNSQIPESPSGTLDPKEAPYNDGSTPKAKPVMSSDGYCFWYDELRGQEAVTECSRSYTCIQGHSSCRTTTKKYSGCNLIIKAGRYQQIIKDYDCRACIIKEYNSSWWHNTTYTCER